MIGIASRLRRGKLTLGVQLGRPLVADIFNTPGSSTLSPAQISGATERLQIIETRLAALGA